MDPKKQTQYLRSYLKVSIFTLVFFLTSFGVMLIKAHLDPNPPHTDNGLGMAYAVFLWPLVLTVLLLLGCIYLLHLSKTNEAKSSVGFVLLSILTVPVGIFGFFMLLATLFPLIKLLLRFIVK